MERYRNLGGKSGVLEYEIGVDFIRVKFNDNSVYLYTNKSCGRDNCETMKSLAVAGEGLNTFINKVVKKAYERKER